MSWVCKNCGNKDYFSQIQNRTDIVITDADDDVKEYVSRVYTELVDVPRCHSCNSDDVTTHNAIED